MTTRIEHERLLVDRVQLAIAALNGATGDAFWPAFDKFKQCRDEALTALSRPIRRRKSARRRET